MSETIVICDLCGGTGTLKIETLTDYHKNIYDVTEEPCLQCEGKGRRVKVVEEYYRPL